MAGPSWLVDKSRIATKIKSASGASNSESVVWKSNPTRACPNCQHVIDNSDVVQEWPGLPKGVKFDPSDQEIILHLLAKVGGGNTKPHPFIDEFITTLEVDDGICYTHPQNLPGVKQDGSASHFFHRAIKAYNTGNRKRRKIHGQDFGDVRWHKTGRTKPVMLDGVQKGCKKIMVLYMSMAKGAKAEKTNWVMHQYHLGTEEDENEGEYVISKVFYQQQLVRLGDKNDLDIPETTEIIEATIVKADPVTPKSVTPDPPRNERRSLDLDLIQESCFNPQVESPKQLLTIESKFPTMKRAIPTTPQARSQPKPQSLMDCVGDELQADCEEHLETDLSKEETIPNEGTDNIENHADEDPKWWDSESQNLLDSQQLVEALSLCDDLLQSQSPNRDGKSGEHNDRPSFSVYAQLGPEHLKKDLEDCQNLVVDPAIANIELETPSEFQLSQLDFSSQDSFTAWGGGKVI